MKKAKIWLSAIAFTAAVGATFATQYPKAPELKEYVFLNGICAPRDPACAAPNNDPCEIDGLTRYKAPDQGVSACSTTMGRP